MIHKLEGSFLINKLRVIHLFEADYNGTIGILFNRKLLYNAEQHKLLNNNQWGCRPHRQAEDALLLKELTYNIANITKTTLATFDNDATGCFDRVPCSPAADLVQTKRCANFKLTHYNIFNIDYELPSDCQPTHTTLAMISKSTAKDKAAVQDPLLGYLCPHSYSIVCKS